MPIKCSRSRPLHLKREVPSGITPLPWVARILPQRLVFPERQNLHSRHSGVLKKREEVGVSCLGLDKGVGSLGDTGLLECHDMVARLDRGDAFAHGFDDAGALVAEDDWKGAFGIFAG